MLPAANGLSPNMTLALDFFLLPSSLYWSTSKPPSTDPSKTSGLPGCQRCLIGSPGWVFFIREFHFANRTGLEGGWIKGLGCVSPCYHLGRAGARCQELAGIRVQSGSSRRDSHLGKVCEPTDSCLAWLGLAGSFSGRAEWELGSWLRADSAMWRRVFRAEMRYLWAPIYKRLWAVLLANLNQVSLLPEATGVHESGRRLSGLLSPWKGKWERARGQEGQVGAVKRQGMWRVRMW